MTMRCAGRVVSSKILVGEVGTVAKAGDRRHRGGRAGCNDKTPRFDLDLLAADDGNAYGSEHPENAPRRG